MNSTLKEETKSNDMTGVISTKKMTKAELKQQILDNIKNEKNKKFSIDKVTVSKNDPIINTVKSVLEFIK